MISNSIFDKDAKKILGLCTVIDIFNISINGVYEEDFKRNSSRG
jgi:hypothetical protein